MIHIRMPMMEDIRRTLRQYGLVITSIEASDQAVAIGHEHNQIMPLGDFETFAGIPTYRNGELEGELIRISISTMSSRENGFNP